MHLTTGTALLTATLARVAGAASPQHALPALACVMLSADGERLTLRAGDLDIQMSASCAAAGTGTTLINARDLLAALRGMRATAVTLDVADGWATIASGTARARLATLPADEWPTVDYSSGEYRSATLPTAALLSALASVEACISADEGRPNLAGAHLSSGYLTATDGHRLSRCELALDIGEGIIPARAVAELRRSLAAGVEVAISLSQRAVRVEAADWSLSARLIDGVFPNVDRVLPAPKPATTARVADLRAVLKAAKAFTDKSERVTLEAVGDTLRITASSVDRGEYSDTMPCEAHDAVCVAVNARYLAETLAAHPDGEVALEMGDPMQPIAIRAPGRVWIIMPLRG